MLSQLLLWKSRSAGVRVTAAGKGGGARRLLVTLKDGEIVGGLSIIGVIRARQCETQPVENPHLSLSHALGLSS